MRPKQSVGKIKDMWTLIHDSRERLRERDRENHLGRLGLLIY